MSAPSISQVRRIEEHWACPLHCVVEFDSPQGTFVGVAKAVDRCGLLVDFPMADKKRLRPGDPVWILRSSPPLAILVVAIGEEKGAWSERIISAPMPVYASALTVMLFLIEIFGNIDDPIPFVYFQF
jgi:hypothetical protein